MFYTSVSFYSSLYAFALNVIINMYLFKKSVSPAT